MCSLWWSNLSWIRTKRIFDGFQKNGFCAVFEVVGENQLVVIDVDGVDEYLSVLLYLLGYAALAGAAFLPAQFVIPPPFVWSAAHTA